MEPLTRPLALWSKPTQCVNFEAVIEISKQRERQSGHSLVQTRRQAMAEAYTLIETAKMNGVEPQADLNP